MTITQIDYYDKNYVGGIIRSKDYLSNIHKVDINITKRYRGGSNGRTYQEIIFIGSLNSITRLKKDVLLIEQQCESDYQDKINRDAKKRKKRKSSKLKYTPCLPYIPLKKKSSNMFEILNNV